MIDVHTHLNDEKLFAISEQIVAKLVQNGISKVIVPSCDKMMNTHTLQLIDAYSNVFGALGIHPSNIADFDFETSALIKSNCQNPKIVAVGEIGLDNHYPNSDLKAQAQVFVEQLKLAKQCNLPVILHLRDAWDEFFEVLNNFGDLFCNGVDVHCFDGDKQIAKRLLDAGFFVSLTALSVENKPKLKEMINYLPLDRIMVETDSPYLLPRKFRHQQEFNTPNNVWYVAECVAEYKNISLDTVEECTTNNAYKLFKKLGEYDAKR